MGWFIFCAYMLYTCMYMYVCMYVRMYVSMYVCMYQGRALWVGKVGSAYAKQNNQVPHFPSGVQLGT